jgi:ribosomal-protein-alanine N-acetyltransferase
MIKEHSAESIWLEVRESNTAALTFYQKNDFNRMYTRKNFYTNPSENAIVMKRNLSPDAAVI